MIDGTSKMLFLNFCLFHFSFHFTVVKNLMEKPSFFIMDFEGSYEFLLRHKCSWSSYFLQWNDGLFRFFRNLHGNAFYFFIFSKWNKYYSLTFYYTFKMQARINEKKFLVGLPIMKYCQPSWLADKENVSFQIA